MRKSRLLGAVCAAILSIASLPSHAQLFDRGGGLIYDDVLDVTWLQDANYSRNDPHYTYNGTMVWEKAMNWASSLHYYDSVRDMTYTDWRLPTLRPINGQIFDTTFSNNGTTDHGYAVTGVGWQDTNGNPTSELGHLYYVTLGNLGVCTPNNNYFNCIQQSDAGLANTGPFINIQPTYWYGTQTYPGSEPLSVWTFNTGGKQSPMITNVTYGAWAVRDGDVGSMAINSAPVADAGMDQTVFIGGIVQVDGLGSSDINEDPLTFSWSITTKPVDSQATLSNPTAVFSTFTVDVPGIYIVQLIVNDGKVDSAPDTVTLETAAPQDSDNDGLTDSQEASLDTDPNNPDTDNDGLNDGAEVNTHGTNPLKADTDGDGVDDGSDAFPLDPSRFELNLDGIVKTTEGQNVCAMALASGQYMFSCDPMGEFLLEGLPREKDGTVKLQVYADGFLPYIVNLDQFGIQDVAMTKSGVCPNYNQLPAPGYYPDSAGMWIDILGQVQGGETGNSICAMVLANGKYTFSCDGEANYSLTVPLDANGQVKLQVYADGFAPTILFFDEFNVDNVVEMAHVTECQ